jgi:hypothetical protein
MCCAAARFAKIVDVEHIGRRIAPRFHAAGIRKPRL